MKEPVGRSHYARTSKGQDEPWAALFQTITNQHRRDGEEAEQREPAHRLNISVRCGAPHAARHTWHACCLRAVNAIKSAFGRLKCHLSLCRLLKLRFFVDSIPSATSAVFKTAAAAPLGAQLSSRLKLPTIFRGELTNSSAVDQSRSAAKQLHLGINTSP